MTNKHKLAIIAWFYVGWFACVYFALWGLSGWTLLLPAPLLLFFLTKRIYSPSQFRFLAILGAIGILFEFAMYKFGSINFPLGTSIFLPVWLISMWLLFLTIFFISQPVFKNRLSLAFVLGTIFGPLSYLSGETFGVLQFTSQYTTIMYALFWGLYFWASQRYARRFV